MGIAPIDLQTLYSQLDKVSKTHGSQAQILQAQSSMEQVEKTKQQLEDNKKINSTKMADEDDTQKITERKERQQQESSSKKEDAEPEEQEEKINKKSMFQDPNLGQHIDVIG